MNLILIDPWEMGESGRVALTGARARHIREVLRAEVGKKLRVGLLNEALGAGRVLAVDENRVELECAFESEPPPRPRLELLLAMPRPKVMKRLWAQIAALGVARVILLRAEKVERYYFDSHVIEPSFYEPLLLEGLSQAKCVWRPDVLVRPFFKPFVEDELGSLYAGRAKILADPSGKKRMRDLNLAETERVTLAIGPEGGWTPYELEMLAGRGFEMFGMGDRVLRSDTATIGVIASFNALFSGE